MNKSKLLNMVFSLLIVASMLLMATSQVSAKKTPTPPPPPAHIHQGKITPADRLAAAQRLAKNTVGAPAALNAQTINPGGTPDYFSFTPNYANSPFPPSVSIIGDGVGALATPVLTGTTVTGFTVVNGGSGYTTAAVSVIGGGASGCLGIPAFTNGAITGITVNPASTCTNYNPNYGIRKFVTPLPNLVIATPDTQTNWPDADYYVIKLKELQWTFSPDLGPTTVRGYIQVLNGVEQPYSYLGPVIQAHSGRPVRIKFINALPTGTGGDLFIPVDTTVMGAGMGSLGSAASGTKMYTQNRAEIHLHGGATPWISDGTPHQWTTPATETTSYPKGVSVQYVPDMDGGTEPQGTLTYYYTNQQSARLMFYHDHAYGITRLNVYAGEAAAYMIDDLVEKAMVNGGGLPSIVPVANAVVAGGAVTAINLVPDVNGVVGGAYYTSTPTVTVAPPPAGPGVRTATAVATMSAGKVTNVSIIDGGAGYSGAPNVTFSTTNFAPPAGTVPANQIPLVIQDKTFVDPVDIVRSDPTWMKSTAKGGLWYPHVYMPNQNPFDLMGSNATGRWDYGPWFWPPQTNLMHGQVANPLYPSLGNPEEGPYNPGTPNPSLAPEAYMDTPVINGVAYPYLNLDNKAYRFRILNASNDRYMNLSLFCAKDTTSTMWSGTTLVSGNAGEVNMVTAAPGTGLPASWPTDGRDGGVPDPLAKGPNWNVIGTEGGFLPAVAVVPPTPVGYEYNRRSITVLNVSNKALYLGPAERADVVVDFSTSPCNRLILYNDAPAPMPAFDPRNDYYTGDPDNTNTGGAPSTQPGYGPNTRTLMQINLSGTVTPYTHQADLVTALPQAFAASQDTPVVPQPPFNTAMGYSASPQNYVRIQDTSISFFNGPLTTFKVLTGGQNYNPATATAWIIPAAGDKGSGATVKPVFTPVVLTALNLINYNSVLGGSGTGYTSVPTVNIIGGGGAGAAGVATITKAVNKVTVTSGGNYTCTAPAVPKVIFTGGTPTFSASATAVMTGTKITSVNLISGGVGYTAAPAVSFSIVGVAGCTLQTTAAKATATITGVVNTVTLTNPGSGYTSVPTVTITGGGGTLAAATFAATASPNPVMPAGYLQSVITGVVLTNSGGANYSSAPTVTICNTGSPATLDCVNNGATAVAVPISIGLGPKAIQELFETDYGRMNATLGVEIPNTNGVNQTTIPYGYVDPMTEILQYTNAATPIGQLADGTQIWKITHNGVDSHPVHFHMFNVQLINRVGWDGMVKPPLAQEVGWKDTVIMNPLEDAIVAIRAIQITLPTTAPWAGGLPNSVRLLDPTSPAGSTTQFFGQDVNGNPVTVVNQMVNFGWEYVWHCHILGHEENDFMRPMVFAVPPVAPNLVTAVPSAGAVTVNFTDASKGETGFILFRATSQTGPWTQIKAWAGAAGTGTPFSFKNTGLTGKTTYWFKVSAINTVGSGIAGYPSVTVNTDVVVSATTP